MGLLAVTTLAFGLATRAPAGQVDESGASGTALDFESIARELSAASPLAADGAAAARDKASVALAGCASLLGACGDTILWGGYDPNKGCDPAAYSLTLFAPEVWARLYLSQFMFTGEHSVRAEGSFEILELKATFRRHLDAGDYPYPLWHSAKKWNDHINVESVMLVARDGQIVAAYRQAPLMTVMPGRRWDGNWHWTSAGGEEQPRVALFDYLFSDDNPHRAPLEESYRKLESGFRSHGCISCHAPDNAAQSSALVLLLYPNQSLGARHSIVQELRRNDMPPADPVTGAAQGIPDDATRLELVALATEYARQGDAALEFERRVVEGTKTVPGGATPDGAPWVTESDDWYSLTLGGTHAGWMRVARENDGERYRSVTEMTLSFQQAGTKLDAESYVEWIESHDGEPLRLEVAKKNKKKLTHFDIGNFSAWEETRDGDPLGLLISNHTWEFDADGVTRVVNTGEETIRRPTAAPSGPWLTPVAAERFIERRITDGGRTLEYGTLDAPGELRYVGVKSALLGNSEFVIEGEMIPVTVWRTQTSVNPGQTISHYSRDGKLVYSSANLGIGVLETRRCSKDEALSQGERLESPQVDLPVLEPDRPFTAGSRAVFELRVEEGKLPRVPSAGAQLAEMSEDGSSARITIDCSKSSPATSPELAESQLRERAPIAGDDAMALELGARAMRESTGLGSRELAISARNVVHKHFAEQVRAAPTVPQAAAGAQLHDRSGSEAARTLCSVLRVHGIDSRVASGLAYDAPAQGKGVFQWRVWTQALVDGRWVDLDPARSTQFDAGHILMGFGGAGNASADPDPAGFSKLLSKLKITVSPAA